MIEDKEDPVIVETAALRKNLSEILSSVRHDEHSRIKIKRHNKFQASIISNDDADLFYDLSEEDLDMIQEAITSYKKEREKRGRDKKDIVDLSDVIKQKKRA